MNTGKKFFVVLVSMVVLGLSAFYLIRLGFYPVAMVEGRFIGARRFEEAVGVAYHYYVKGLGSQASKEIQEQLTYEELRRATLDKLIEEELVLRELKNRVGSDLSDIVESKLNNLDFSAPDFEKAVLALYGLSVQRFKEMVLVPKAREEVLEGRIFKDGSKDLIAWLKDRKQKARVTVFAPDLRWDDNKVGIR